MASSHAEAELAATSAARSSADSGYSSGEESGWGAGPPSDSDGEVRRHLFDVQRPLSFAAKPLVEIIYDWEAETPRRGSKLQSTPCRA